MDIDFSNINFTPFVVFIVLGAILIIAIEKIGSSALSNSSGGGHHFGSGSGDKKDIVENVAHFVANSTSGIRSKQRQREAAQRALIRQIKITGLIAGFALIIAISSIFSILGATDKIAEKEFGPIMIPIAGLIMGSVFTIAFSIRFFQLKRQYELYYGSIFGKKR